MAADTIIIGDDTPAAWRAYSDSFYYVPDPMILRTAELFINGRSGCSDLGAEDEIWAGIDANLHGLLTFFNALMTNEAVPLIAYYDTFPQTAKKTFHDFMGDLAVYVVVDKTVYNEVRKSALRKLQEINLGSVPSKDAEDVAREFLAFRHEWLVEWDGAEALASADEQTQRMARFVLGALIFGYYAAASDTDHLLQNKRSRVFAALTKPEYEGGLVDYGNEEKLFEALKDACTNSEAVRVDEIPAFPTVIPRILKEEPKSTQALFDRVMAMRNDDLGIEYRQWFTKLRQAIARGEHAREAKREIDAVRQELEHRLHGKHWKWSREIDLSWTIPSSPVITAATGVNMDIGGLEVGLGKIRIGIPDWIRNWILDDLKPGGAHRKFMLRAAVSQADYDHLTKGLRKLWRKS